MPVLLNTYAQKKAEVDALIQWRDPSARLIVNLDDMTLVRNPDDFSTLMPALATFEMGVTVASGASYTLGDNVSMAATKILTVNGRLNCGTFTIGGAASFAAGPVGRSADAATDAKLSSQILAYSRTNGLFAGATLEGAALRADKDANEAFYGRQLGVKAITNEKEPTIRSSPLTERWRARLREIASPK